MPRIDYDDDDRDDTPATDWRRRLTARGLAMLAASARLHEYLRARVP